MTEVPMATVGGEQTKLYRSGPASGFFGQFTEEDISGEGCTCRKSIHISFIFKTFKEGLITPFKKIFKHRTMRVFRAIQ